MFCSLQLFGICCVKGYCKGLENSGQVSTISTLKTEQWNTYETRQNFEMKTKDLKPEITAEPKELNYEGQYILIVKNSDWISTAQVQILTLQLTSCVTLSTSLNLSGPVSSSV